MGQQCQGIISKDSLVEDYSPVDGQPIPASPEIKKKNQKIAEKIAKSKVKVSEFPLAPPQIQSKIEKLSKEYSKDIRQQSRPEHQSGQGQKSNIYKTKYPFAMFFKNLDNHEQFPAGRCVIYKIKEDNQFGGYFEGQLKDTLEVDLNDCFIVFSNGSYFYGQGNNKGTYQNESSGLKYQGGWYNECPDGKGTQRNNKGVYEGEYVSGQKQGKGKFTWNDGYYYEGHFERGQFSGNGLLKDQAENYQYEGEFLSGQKHGRGIQKIKNQVYQGQFKYGQRSGMGKLYIYKSGSKDLKQIFQGFFNQNAPHGRGTLKIIEDGSEKKKIEGIWTKGNLTLIS